MGRLLIVVKVDQGFASVVDDLFRMIAVDYSMVFDSLKLGLKLGWVRLG